MAPAMRSTHPLVIPPLFAAPKREGGREERGEREIGETTRGRPLGLGRGEREGRGGQWAWRPLL
eukprot:9489336-Pyramimonas_sp.AAC.1